MKTVPGRPSKRFVNTVDLLICVVFVVCPILASNNANDERDNTYAEKTEDDSRLSKNSPELLLSADRNGNHDLPSKTATQRTKASSDSSALSRFLEDVLRAQDDLKWIDQTVRGVKHEKDREKSQTLRTNKNSESLRNEAISLAKANRDDKRRGKRSFNQNYDEMWASKHKYGNKDSSDTPRHVYAENDMPYKNDIDFSDVDRKGVPKDWSKPEDICSLSDWLNSNHEPETAQERQRSRWIRDFEDRPSLNGGMHGPYNVRNQRDEAKQEEPPTLESLKQTVLELKKSLTEADAKHEVAKDVNSGKSKDVRKERRSHDKDKQESGEKNADDESNWWEPSGSENFDLRKREQASEDLDKNAQPKVWRTKRTEEVNNDGGSLKLFHRAGFGEPYLEEKALKELHDRKRRSKGTPSKEKRYSNEPADKNNSESDEKTSDELSKLSSCREIDDPAKKALSSDNSQGKMTKYIEESVPAPRDSNSVGDKLTTDEGKGESLETNPSQVFGSATNELQPAFAKASGNLEQSERDEAEESKMKKEDNQKDVGLDKEAQLIKDSEPRAPLYRNDERVKEVRGIATDEEDHGKLSQQQSEEKRSSDQSGNINLLLKSENKNIVQLRNADEKSSNGEQQPLTMNTYGVDKKMIVENEENAGKSTATIVNVEVEKARIDAGPKADDNREEDFKRRSSDFDFGKNKLNEELYKDTPELASDLKQRIVDEERLKNSAEFDKGSARSGDNEGGRNWYEGVVGNQVGMNIDQGRAEKYKEEGESDKFGNEEERFRENKKDAGAVESSNDGAVSSDENAPSQDDKAKDYGDRDKHKYREVFIVPDNFDERKLNDRYVQRRMLQYVEYSNDDIEDDSSYGENEEEESQQQAGAVGSNAHVKRKERSSRGNPLKAEVNVLIKNKMNHKGKRVRQKRREPDVIEYYDYDSSLEHNDHEAMSAGDQDSLHEENGSESDSGPAKCRQGAKGSAKYAKKGRDEQEEEVLKQEREREKQGNRAPQQQFIETIGPKNDTEKTKKPDDDSLRLTSKLTFADEEAPSLANREPGRLDQGEDNANGINRGRLNEPLVTNDEQLSEKTAKNPEKCALNNYLNAEVINDFLEDLQLIDQKNEKMNQNVDPLYDELRKLYDGSDGEWKSKSRIKGDQRMNYGDDDKVDSMNTVDESFKDQIEPLEIQSQSESTDSSPNLLPLLMSHGGQEKSETVAKPNPTVSSGQPESPGASNVSQSNYFALKSTDDMFKGGSEQSNSTEEKLRGASSIVAAVQPPTQKVNGKRNDATAEKYPASGSLTDRRQYVDTDSRFPNENRKYLESRSPRERVQNTDREKRMVISARDLHESFVEPSNWIDDFDKDSSVRLSRGLKTVENANFHLAKDTNAQVLSNVTKKETITSTSASTENSSVEISEATVAASVSPSSELASITPPSTNLESSSVKDNVRVRRKIDDSYEASYDDEDERERDSGEMDYDGYSKNAEETELLDSYDDANDVDDEFSESNADVKEEEASEEEEDEDVDYKKATRSIGSRKKKKKKRHKGGGKKQTKKSSNNKSKYSNTRRKRRNRKKNSESGTKNHECDQKKHKKRKKSASHHTSVKKSKAPQDDGKGHVARHRDAAREKMGSEDAMNPDNDFRDERISMLLAADNIEDESQMDSALRGELAGQIVEHIFEQVQNRENLKVSLGPGLYQKHKTEDTVAADRRYRQTLNDDEMKHTEKLLKKVMMLLNRLVYDEVQRKTCVALSPELIQFLNWMLESNPREMSMEQMPSLPLVHDDKPPDHTTPQDKFLFQNPPDHETGTDMVELRKKLRLIESLIRKYAALSDKEKTKVRSVHDYLAKQLDLLVEYIDARKDAAEKGKSLPSTRAAAVPSGRILEYQTRMRNAANGSYLRSTDHFSPFANVPSFMEASNASIDMGGDYFHDNGVDFRHKSHRTARSPNHHAQKRKKHRKRIRHKKKHHKRHKGANAIDKPRHKTSVHKASSRHKRGYLDKDFWDFLESGYEKPLIYSSMDLTNLKPKGNDDPLREESNVRGETEEKKPRYWKDIDRSKLTKRNSKIDGEKKNQLSNTKSQSENAVATIKKAEESVSNLDTDKLAAEEEPITGKNRLEDEVILLNKRQAWKKENEEQLEEVAFGEDMRKGTRDKELFEELTEMDKKNSASESSERTRRNG